MPSVLVVDDDIDISEALLQALEYGGYDTSAAFTGAAALAEVRRSLPDLVPARSNVAGYRRRARSVGGSARRPRPGACPSCF